VANSQVKTKDQSDYKNIFNAFVDDDKLAMSYFTSALLRNWTSKNWCVTCLSLRDQNWSLSKSF